MSFGIRTRPRRADQFAQIDNAFLRDQSLSIEARGLGAYLLTHAGTFRVSAKQLAKACRIGRDKMRRIVAELEAAGYLVRESTREDGGQFGEIAYSMSDEKDLVEPAPENPAPVHQSLETRTHKNTNSKNTNDPEHQLSEGTTANAAPAPESEPTPEEDVKLKPPVDAPGLFEMAAPPKPPSEPSAKDVVGAYVDAFRAAHGRDPLKQDKSRIGRDSGGLLKREESTVAELILCAREMGKGIHANMATQLKIHRGTGAKPANNSVSSLPILNGDPRWDEAAEQTRREGAELLAANADAWDGVFA